MVLVESVLFLGQRKFSIIYYVYSKKISLISSSHFRLNVNESSLPIRDVLKSNKKKKIKYTEKSETKKSIEFFILKCEYFLI